MQPYWPIAQLFHGIQHPLLGLFFNIRQAVGYAGDGLGGDSGCSSNIAD